MNNALLAHAWANQTREKAKGNNFYFEGTKIYSYGEHYLLGNLFPEQKIALINSRGYSSTTGKHTRHALNALSSQWTIIRTPRPEADNMNAHQENAAYLAELIQKSLKDIKTARVRLGQILDNLDTQRANLKLYARSFKIKAGIIPGLSSKQKTKYVALAREYITRAEASAIKRQERTKAAEALELESWRNHNSTKRYFYNSDIALRMSADGKRIETSRGAEVGILTAREVYKRYKAGEALKGAKLNGFTIDSIDFESVVIGCHIIPLTEIEKIMEVK